MVQHIDQVGSEWQDGGLINMSGAMYHLTLSIVADTLFNSCVKEQTDQIAESLTTLVSRFHLFLLPMANLWMRAPLPGTNDIRKALKQLDTTVYAMIAERQNSGIGQTGDLLDLLLAHKIEQAESDRDLTDLHDIRDQVMTLFLAGHETTANAMVMELVPTRQSILKFNIDYRKKSTRSLGMRSQVLSMFLA